MKGFLSARRLIFDKREESSRQLSAEKAQASKLVHILRQRRPDNFA